jgi:hypothetical protein
MGQDIDRLGPDIRVTSRNHFIGAEFKQARLELIAARDCDDARSSSICRLNRSRRNSSGSKDNDGLAGAECS